MDQVAYYIIASVGAPRKGIAKDGMLVTDTSLPTYPYVKTKKTTSNAPAITIGRKIAISDTLKARQTIPMPRFALKYAENTYIHKCDPYFRSQSVKDCHNDYNYKKLPMRKDNIKQSLLNIVLPRPMTIPRSTQRSAVWTAAARKC